jgi:endonuclease/exonuclease/phosphatase family metal-dependent hydrolase
VLTSSGACIIALQEVRCEWQLRRATETNVLPPDLSRLLAGFCAMHFVFGSTIDDLPGYPPNTNYLEWGDSEKWQNNGATHGEYGNAVLTSDVLESPPLNIPLPMSQPGEEQRAALRVQVRAQRAADQPLVIYATHLHHQHPATRQKQMAAILDRARTETTTTTVFLMGDLNSSPGPNEPDLIGMAVSAGFHDLAGEYAREHNESTPNTFPTDKPDHRIDYIFCSHPMPILDVHTIETTASDHLPLMATVILPR